MTYDIYVDLLFTICIPVCSAFSWEEAWIMHLLTQCQCHSTAKKIDRVNITWTSCFLEQCSTAKYDNSAALLHVVVQKWSCFGAHLSASGYVFINTCQVHSPIAQHVQLCWEQLTRMLDWFGLLGNVSPCTGTTNNGSAIRTGTGVPH